MIEKEHTRGREAEVIPPPVRYGGGVNIQEGRSTPCRSAWIEALNSPGKEIMVEKPNEHKLLSCILKESRRPTEIDAQGSSSTFMEKDSSLQVAGDLGDTCVNETEIAHEGPTADFAATAIVEIPYDSMAEAFTCPGGLHEPASEIVIEASTKGIRASTGSNRRG